MQLRFLVLLFVVLVLSLFGSQNVWASKKRKGVFAPEIYAGVVDYDRHTDLGHERSFDYGFKVTAYKYGGFGIDLGWIQEFRGQKTFYLSPIASNIIRPLGVAGVSWGVGINYLEIFWSPHAEFGGSIGPSVGFAIYEKLNLTVNYRFHWLYKGAAFHTLNLGLMYLHWE